MTKYKLKLYITGQTPTSELAVKNLWKLCEEDLDNRYQLEIIDILEHPQLAENEKILATPTLIKELPLPIRRIIGDLSQKEKILLGRDMFSFEEFGDTERGLEK